MGWIGKWPFRGSPPVKEIENNHTEEPVTGAPHLILLASDASGLASFQLTTFSQVEPAAEFVKRSFGTRTDTGLVAFWASTSKPIVKPEPGSDSTVEAIVLVRHEAGSDIVYPFSFLDIGMALSFVQYEMGRGLDPSLVLVYWAVPIQLVIGVEGTVRLSPGTAPEISEEPLDTPHFTEPTRLERVAAKTLRSAVSEPVFVSTQDDPIEALFDAAGQDAAAVEEDTHDDESGNNLNQTEFDEQAGGGDEAAGQSALETVADDVIADETSAETEEPVVIDEAPTAGMNGATSFIPATQEPITAIGRDFIGRSEPAGREFPAGKAFGMNRMRFDVGNQVDNVLRVRRWEEHTTPFTGFNSPPGRF